MTTLKFFDRSIKVVIQGDEGRLLLLLQQKKVLTHEIKSVFWSVMVATYRNAIDNFFFYNNAGWSESSDVLKQLLKWAARMFG